MAISRYDTLEYAKFNPLSTEEIWKPLQYMREQHDKLEEEYANLSFAAKSSMSGIDPNKDADAQAAYNQYSEELKKAADDLSTKGYTDSGRRTNLMNLKRMYSEKLIPYQQTLAQRNAIIDEQRKIGLTNQTTRFTSDAKNLSLSEIMANPSILQYEAVSGDQLAKSVEQKAANLKEFNDNGKITRIPTGLKNTYLLRWGEGISLKDIEAAAKREGYDAKEVNAMTRAMHDIVNSTMNEYGVYEKFKNKPQDIDYLWNTAASGLYSAKPKAREQIAVDQYQMAVDEYNLQHPPTRQNIFSDENKFVVNLESGRILDANGGVISEPTFNKNGWAQAGVEPSSMNVMPTSYGSVTTVTPSKYHKPTPQEISATNAWKSEFKNYRDKLSNGSDKDRAFAKTATEKQLYSRMLKEKYDFQKSLTRENVVVTPITNLDVNKYILNDHFVNSPGQTQVYRMDNSGNYSKDIGSGYDLASYADSKGVTIEQLSNWIGRNGNNVGVGSNGMYVVSLPSKFKQITVGGKTEITSDGNKYEHIGFSKSAMHNEAIKTSNKVIEARNSGKRISLNNGELIRDSDSGYYFKEIIDPNVTISGQHGAYYLELYKDPYGRKPITGANNKNIHSAKPLSEFNLSLSASGYAIGSANEVYDIISQKGQSTNYSQSISQ